ncbi:MAG: hypothetical protein AAF802_28070 [Planctomycetota bacterium]
MAKKKSASIKSKGTVAGKKRVARAKTTKRAKKSLRVKKSAREKAARSASKDSSCLSDSGFDFSSASVNTIQFYDFSIELGLGGVAVPEKEELIEATICFDVIQSLIDKRFELGNRLFDAFGKKMYKPKTKLSKLLAQKKSGKFCWSVQFTLSPMRKPFEFKCKRIVLKSKTGRFLAGDQRTNKHQWNKTDYQSFASTFCESIRAEDYAESLKLMDSKLAKRRTADKLAKEFSKWKKVPNGAKEPPNTFLLTLMYSDLGDGYLADENANLDPDLVRADFDVTFVGQFMMELRIVSEGDQLRVGKYKPHREW